MKGQKRTRRLGGAFALGGGSGWVDEGCFWEAQLYSGGEDNESGRVQVEPGGGGAEGREEVGAARGGLKWAEGVLFGSLRDSQGIS